MTVSLPPWERGLKYKAYVGRFHFRNVAPPVGAWIEIRETYLWYRTRGVAPPVGAWIEISVRPTVYSEGRIVAPPVGAWIEI